MATKQGLVDIMINLLEKHAEPTQRAIKAIKEYQLSEYSEGQKAYCAEANKTSKKLKKKLAADPNKPKRSPSGYHLFLSGKTRSFKEENPDKTPKEIQAIVTKKWLKDSTPDEKGVYMKQAADLRVEYEEKLDEYNRGLKSSSCDSSPSPVTSTSSKALNTPAASDVVLLLKKRTSQRILSSEEVEKIIKKVKAK